MEGINNNYRIIRREEYFMGRYDELYADTRSEFNNLVATYQAQGFNIREKTDSYCKLTKRGYSMVAFILLLIFIFPLAFLYYFITNKKRVIIYYVPAL